MIEKDSWEMNLEGVRVVFADKIDVPKDEYLVVLDRINELRKIAQQLDETVIIVGNRIAMVIDRRGKVPIRYLYVK